MFYGTQKFMNFWKILRINPLTRSALLAYCLQKLLHCLRLYNAPVSQFIFKIFQKFDNFRVFQTIVYNWVYFQEDATIFNFQKSYLLQMHSFTYELLQKMMQPFFYRSVFTLRGSLVCITPCNNVVCKISMEWVQFRP